MAYVPTKWENLPSTNTPLDADNLNHIEQGVKAAHDSLESVSTGKLDKAAVVQVTGSSATNVMSQDAATKTFQPKGNYALKGESYTKAESDGEYQPKGDYATNTALTSGLNGKFDKTGGTITGDVTFSKSAIKSREWTHTLPDKSGTLMQVGDYGWGAGAKSSSNWNEITESGVYVAVSSSQPELPESINNLTVLHIQSGRYSSQIALRTHQKITSTWRRSKDVNGWGEWYEFYTTANTTKDPNGNLKVASPIVKVFADHIETNNESEGATMEYLGVGHYLVKGVLGFNADGAWGINNGLAIPQDHNGKNMILIDYDVKQDGDIELFVFHQQNADMPERFQNKRIKDFDKDGNPIYFENYEPCDVPESRWIDMRVEMPEDSIYNIKKAEEEEEEAERLSKEDEAGQEADVGKQKKK